MALSWFHKNRAFDTINPNKSYAQAVKNTSTVLDYTKIHNRENPVARKTYKKFSYGKIHNANAIQTHKKEHNLPIVAGVPVKYGKCVPAKHSVPCAPSTTKLRNRFRCLQDYVVVNDVIHNDIHTNTVENHRDDSIHVSAVRGKIKHKKTVLRGVQNSSDWFQ